MSHPDESLYGPSHKRRAIEITNGRETAPVRRDKIKQRITGIRKRLQILLGSALIHAVIGGIGYSSDFVGEKPEVENQTEDDSEKYLTSREDNRNSLETERKAYEEKVKKYGSGEDTFATINFELDRLQQGIDPIIIELGKKNFDLGMGRLKEQEEKKSLQEIVDNFISPEAYNWHIGTVSEALALSGINQKESCIPREEIIAMALDRKYPGNKENIWVQKFAGHRRVLYKSSGKTYIMEGKVSEFPDNETRRYRSAIMSYDDYLRLRAGAEEEELKTLQYIEPQKQETKNPEKTLPQHPGPSDQRGQFDGNTGLLDDIKLKKPLEQGSGPTGDYYEATKRNQKLLYSLIQKRKNKLPEAESPPPPPIEQPLEATIIYNKLSTSDAKKISPQNLYDVLYWVEEFEGPDTIEALSDKFSDYTPHNLNLPHLKKLPVEQGRALVKLAGNSTKVILGIETLDVDLARILAEIYELHLPAVKNVSSEALRSLLNINKYKAGYLGYGSLIIRLEMVNAEKAAIFDQFFKGQYLSLQGVNNIEPGALKNMHFYTSFPGISTYRSVAMEIENPTPALTKELARWDTIEDLEINLPGNTPPEALEELIKKDLNLKLISPDQIIVDISSRKINFHLTITNITSAQAAVLKNYRGENFILNYLGSIDINVLKLLASLPVKYLTISKEVFTLADAKILAQGKTQDLTLKNLEYIEPEALEELKRKFSGNLSLHFHKASGINPRDPVFKGIHIQEI